MKLYHGSTEVVRTPEIRVPSHTLDYGSGFYLTTSREQARSWVLRRMKENRLPIGYINVFEFDESFVDILDSLIFETTTDQWIDFVMSNRTVRGFSHHHDIVYGPVANDRVYAAFALYEGGFINKQELKEQLKTYTLVDQYLFHTERSLTALEFTEYEEVKL